MKLPVKLGNLFYIVLLSFSIAIQFPSCCAIRFVRLTSCIANKEKIRKKKKKAEYKYSKVSLSLFMSKSPKSL